MNSLELYMFWTQYADAAGAALIVAALAAIGWYFTHRAHERELAAQRTADRALRDADRAELHDRYGRIIKHLAQRRPTFDEQITQAIGHTRPGPVRTPLSDAYALERTVADVPSPYTPVWTGGEVRW